MTVQLQQFETELNIHQQSIDQCIARGKELVSANHYASKEIRAKSDAVDDAWSMLLRQARDRRNALQLSVKGQQFLADAADTEGTLTSISIFLV